ncbi:Uncharacterised protein [Vibrio cholerae]|nr:Uncharacterised protein [Vibrio cholerae]
MTMSRRSGREFQFHHQKSLKWRKDWRPEYQSGYPYGW